MKNFSAGYRGIRRIALTLILGTMAAAAVKAQQVAYKSSYSTFVIDGKGNIISIKDRRSGKEYCPGGMSSPLLSLCEEKKIILPEKAAFSSNNSIRLQYPNGSVAVVRVVNKGKYLRFRLDSLLHRNDVDNVIWGPYKTTISRTIGELISVVRNDDFAIGMLALDDNTTSGPPTDGDFGVTYYYIHSPDPKKFPLPANLKEGQCFKIGGDGRSDIAFFSQPEEYYRMNSGNGAKLEPAFGSSICLHSRDRRKEQMIRFPVLPENLDGGFNSARYQLVTATNADFIGSSIALYACPDTLGLHTIENIVLNEGLPHPEIDGIWIKDPRSFRPDIAWSGPHDSLISYAAQLGISGVQDEGWGEYYPNPANRWTKKGITFSGRDPMTIPAYGALVQKAGIRYGLHTLTEFLQPNNNVDVAPVPNDSLAIMQRSILTRDLNEGDSIICVADTCYFNEYGGWEGNETNILKVGKELIEYNGITTTRPYTFLHVKRGMYGTKVSGHVAGDTIVKLQPNCYHGFAPDMNLQEDYAAYYGRWLTDGGMDYIDFDGLESCMYQGQGQYSFKRFFRKLFDTYQANGGKYLRVMGSAVYEGNWHYMSVCNVGGGDRMFSPVLNKWGIEGKDIRYIWESNYLPATFGIVDLEPDWSTLDAENLQAKSIGWDATYMLGLSQNTVERCGNKEAIFKAFSTWEEARKANVFTNADKNLLKDLDYKFHLEKVGDARYLLYPVREYRQDAPVTADTAGTLSVNNKFGAQEFYISARITEGRGKHLTAKLALKLNGRVITPGDFTLSAGEYLVSKGGSLYLADKNRADMKKVVTGPVPQLLKGENILQWDVQISGDKPARLELVVTSTGPGKVIGKNKIDSRSKTEVAK